MRTIENANGRGGTQKAVRGSQMLKGAVKAAGGIASGNFAAVAQGAAEALSPKVLAAIACILVFLILLPIIIISAIPQMLFSWGTVKDNELIARNQHGTELVEYYEETIDSLKEGINPNPAIGRLCTTSLSVRACFCS